MPSTLPTAMQYREAIQNPDLAFIDPELGSGVPVLDRLGLPRASSGSFAAVFHVRCGPRQYAVRCFLRSTEGAHERYRLISEALAEAPATAGRWTVSFEYVTAGIRVARAVHPLIKMEWVDGIQLHTWVGANLGRPDRVYELGTRFLTMMRDLRVSGLAHGDLQHGNILVTRTGSLKLVDYDCMFTPRMAGRPAPELGHPNYQHPKRSPEQFGPTLDDFSSWVIYVSLVALAYAPQLWSRFAGGDECLFLRKKDLLFPGSSEAIAAMREAIAEPRFQEMLDAFVWTLDRAPDAILPLPPIGRAAPVEVGLPAPDAGMAERGRTPDWIAEVGTRAADVGGARGVAADGPTGDDDGDDDAVGPVAGDSRSWLAHPLRRFRIRDAALPGFGASIIEALEQAGFVTAQDFAGFVPEDRRARDERCALIRANGGEVYVPGIGYRRAAQLQAWKEGLGAQTTATAPVRVAPVTAAAKPPAPLPPGATAPPHPSSSVSALVPAPTATRVTPAPAATAGPAAASPGATAPPVASQPVASPRPAVPLATPPQSAAPQPAPPLITPLSAASPPAPPAPGFLAREARTIVITVIVVWCVVAVVLSTFYLLRALLSIL